VSWQSVLEHGAEIVRNYDTGVTLRQLFYRLVADGTLPNTHTAYKGLSRTTAEARRREEFPALVDRRRQIARPMFFTDASDARSWLHEDVFRLDRTQGQPFNIYVGSEKDALSALLESWLDERGIPVLVVGGWHSEGYERGINRDLSRFGRDRKSVLFYVGDLDPAGEGIEANITKHVDFDDVRRVALHQDQALAMALPENSDPDVARKLRNHPGRIAFEKRYGRLFQIEVDAVEPNTLRDLVNAAIDDMWDRSAFEAVLAREDDERSEL
jgi:hypothetical protein